MAKSFKVVDLIQPGGPTETVITNVHSPEEAARIVLGLDVVRSGGKHRNNPVCRVYWRPEADKPANMVRLYQRIGT